MIKCIYAHNPVGVLCSIYMYMYVAYYNIVIAAVGRQDH